jgi:hypothetical protein
MSPIINTPLAEGVNGGRVKVVRAKYDFAVEGGAISTIGLLGQTAIPSGVVIVDGYVDITTQCTGAGASIAIQVEAANDIITAVAIASWTVGRKNILPGLTPGALTANTAVVKTTAARDVSIVISGGAVTAGVFNVVLRYVDALA